MPCHRLDSSTGGLVVCSKSKASEVSLMKSFRSKFIKKTYLAIVAGKLEPFSGTIDSKVGDKDARTLYEVVKYTRSAQYDWLSTVKLWPVTGRKHQLRRHMAELRHAIIGDRRFTSNSLIVACISMLLCIFIYVFSAKNMMCMHMYVYMHVCMCAN